MSETKRVADMKMDVCDLMEHLDAVGIKVFLHAKRGSLLFYTASDECICDLTDCVEVDGKVVSFTADRDRAGRLCDVIYAALGALGVSIE